MPRLATLPLLLAALAGLSVAGCVQGLGDTTALVNVGRLGEFATIEVGTDAAATPLTLAAPPERVERHAETTVERTFVARTDSDVPDAATPDAESDAYRELRPAESDVLLVAVPRSESTTAVETPGIPEVGPAVAAAPAGRIQTVSYRELAVPAPKEVKNSSARMDEHVTEEIPFEVVEVVEDADEPFLDAAGTDPAGVELVPIAGLDIEPAVRAAAIHKPAEPAPIGDSEPAEPPGDELRAPLPVVLAFERNAWDRPEFADWTLSVGPRAREPRRHVSDDLAVPRELPVIPGEIPSVADASSPADEPEFTTESPLVSTDTIPTPPGGPVLDPDVVAIPVVAPSTDVEAEQTSGELSTLDSEPQPAGVVELRAPETVTIDDEANVRPRPAPLELPDPYALDDIETTTEEYDENDGAPIQPTAFDLEPVPYDEAPLPLPAFDDLPPYVASAGDCGCQTGVVAPIFGEVCLGEADRCWCGECSPWKKLFKFQTCRENCDIGIGRQRLPFAPFEIESPQPGNLTTLRYDAAYGMDHPDRSEFFWAKIGGGGPPLVEREVDYQRFWLIHEVGGGKFSMSTEIPVVFLNPEINTNTAGLGDIRVAPKVVLIDGRDWQLSHVFRTYIPSAPKRKGLGTGHTSLEPGFLLRYAWTEDTELFGQLKFWFPIAGDQDHAGPAIRYGFGWASVMCDTDTFAILGTLEMTGVSYLDGQATLPDGLLVSPDGETSFNVQPGARFVLGPAGDLGLFSVGLSGGHAFSINGQYENQFRLDLRWAY